MSINSKMTAIADEIRELSGATEAMGLDAMASNLGEANDEVGSQVSLLAQAVAALEGKAAGSGSTTVDDVSKAIITRAITEISDDEIGTIGANAFYNCHALTTASFPAVITIGTAAFNMCKALTTISFPAATTIGTGVFADCTALTTASFPAVTSIGSTAFYCCTALTTVSFPAAITIGNSAFNICTALTTASFPAVTSIGSTAFYDCTALTTASFPVATSIGSNAFFRCTALTTVSFPKATSIDDDAFYNCYNLKSLYLTGFSVCQLSNSNAFTKTPIGGYSASAGTYGSIYVPASLLTSYQTATNWTYFSSRFVGIDVGGDTGNIVTFTLDGKQYSAEEGMTFGEWVDSVYNVDGWQKDIVGTGLAKPNIPMPYGIQLSTVIENSGVY